MGEVCCWGGEEVGEEAGEGSRHCVKALDDLLLGRGTKSHEQEAVSLLSSNNVSEFGGIA